MQCGKAFEGLDCRGKPIYGECGGFMYLGRTLVDLKGRSWPMTGLLPVDFRMLEKLRALGYRQVGLTSSTPLGPSGLWARGHEFHYSEIARLDACHKVYSCTDRNGSGREAQGYMMGNILASYVHLHFGSNPLLAAEICEILPSGGRQVFDMMEWNLPPGEIEKRSFAIIDAEAPEHSWPPEVWSVIRRMIHTTADFEYVTSVRSASRGSFGRGRGHQAGSDRGYGHQYGPHGHDHPPPGALRRPGGVPGGPPGRGPDRPG